MLRMARKRSPRRPLARYHLPAHAHYCCYLGVRTGRTNSGGTCGRLKLYTGGRWRSATLCAAVSFAWLWQAGDERRWWAGTAFVPGRRLHRRGRPYDGGRTRGWRAPWNAGMPCSTPIASPRCCAAGTPHLAGMATVLALLYCFVCLPSAHVQPGALLRPSRNIYRGYPVWQTNMKRLLAAVSRRGAGGKSISRLTCTPRALSAALLTGLRHMPSLPKRSLPALSHKRHPAALAHVRFWHFCGRAAWTLRKAGGDMTLRRQLFACASSRHHHCCRLR